MHIICYLGNTNIKLDVLAQLSNMSVNQFLRVFKTTFNTTPIRFINTVRIRKACEAIRIGSPTLTETALDTGFPDSNYFSRTFKKIMGISPSKYKKLVNRFK